MAKQTFVKKNWGKMVLGALLLGAILWYFLVFKKKEDEKNGKKLSNGAGAGGAKPNEDVSAGSERVIIEPDLGDLGSEGTGTGSDIGIDLPVSTGDDQAPVGTPPSGGDPDANGLRVVGGDTGYMGAGGGVMNGNGGGGTGRYVLVVVQCNADGSVEYGYRPEGTSDVDCSRIQASSN